MYTEIIYVLTSGTCTLKSYDISWLQVPVHWNHVSWLQVPVHWNHICFDFGYLYTETMICLDFRYLYAEIVYVLTYVPGTCTLKLYMFWLQEPVHWNPMICSDFRYLYTLEDEGVTQPDQTFEVGTSHISSMESRREQGRGVVLTERWKMWGDGRERRKGVITFWWGCVGGWGGTGVQGRTAEVLEASGINIKAVWHKEGKLVWSKAWILQT